MDDNDTQQNSESDELKKQAEIQADQDPYFKSDDSGAIGGEAELGYTDIESAQGSINSNQNESELNELSDAELEDEDEI